MAHEFDWNYDLGNPNHIKVPLGQSIADTCMDLSVQFFIPFYLLVAGYAGWKFYRWVRRAWR